MKFPRLNGYIVIICEHESIEKKGDGDGILGGGGGVSVLTHHPPGLWA
jgi:hypothetical protein